MQSQTHCYLLPPDVEVDRVVVLPESGGKHEGLAAELAEVPHAVAADALLVVVERAAVPEGLLALLALVHVLLALVLVEVLVVLHGLPRAELLAAHLAQQRPVALPVVHL